jgi:hypothetical protein
MVATSNSGSFPAVLPLALSVGSVWPDSTPADSNKKNKIWIGLAI